MGGLCVVAQEYGVDGVDFREGRKTGQRDCAEAPGRAASEGVCHFDIAIVDIVIVMVMVMVMIVAMVMIVMRMMRVRLLCPWREPFRQGYNDRG